MPARRPTHNSALLARRPAPQPVIPQNGAPERATAEVAPPPIVLQHPRQAFPAAIRHANLIALQRSVGNHAVNRIIHADRQASAHPPGMIQRVWQRVPRSRFPVLEQQIGVLANADIVYAFRNPNAVTRVLVRFQGGNTVLYDRANGAFIQNFTPHAIAAALNAAQIDAPTVALPANAHTHIFQGTPSGNTHSGVHSRRQLAPADRILAQTAADANGVYAALVLRQGNAVSKSSLMFPDGWDEHDIAEAIQNAVTRIQPGNIFGLRFGPSGPLIQGFNIGMRFGGPIALNSLETAFPIGYNGQNYAANAVDQLFPNKATLEQQAAANAPVVQMMRDPLQRRATRDAAAPGREPQPALREHGLQRTVALIQRNIDDKQARAELKVKGIADKDISAADVSMYKDLRNAGYEAQEISAAGAGVQGADFTVTRNGKTWHVEQKGDLSWTLVGNLRMDSGAHSPAKQMLGKTQKADVLDGTLKQRVEQGRLGYIVNNLKTTDAMLAFVIKEDDRGDRSIVAKHPVTLHMVMQLITYAFKDKDDLENRLSKLLYEPVAAETTRKRDKELTEITEDTTRDISEEAAFLYDELAGKDWQSILEENDARQVLDLLEIAYTEARKTIRQKTGGAYKEGDDEDPSDKTSDIKQYDSLAKIGQREGQGKYEIRLQPVFSSLEPLRQLAKQKDND